MRIGYLLQLGEEIRHPPFNGPANHIRQVFSQLAARGHRVKLIFRLEGRLWTTQDLKTYKVVTAGKTEMGVGRATERGLRKLQTVLKLPYFGFFDSRHFAHACHQEIPNCDLYYERFSWMTYGGLMAANRAGIPWVVEYNGDPLDDLESKGIAPVGLQRMISKVITRKILRSASHIVATGEGWSNNCVESWGVPPTGVSVIENGTELLHLLQRDDLRSFQPPSQDRTKAAIVYLGGFYSWHGVDRLLRAAAMLIRRGAVISVILIGSGTGEKDARRHASELGLDAHVTFTGRLGVEDYGPILANSDIGVSPYCGWREFSGLKIFDYKAAGLACVASGDNGQPTSLRHGQTGWIVPPCDEEALADALFMLIGDTSLCRKLGQAARHDAEQNNSWSQTARRLEGIFGRVVGK